MKHRSRFVIGMDLGDKKSEAFVLDKKTGSCDRFEVRTTRKAMSEVFSTYESSRVAIEVGTHSRWVSALLSDLGHEVVVANARQVRWIYAADDKSDKTDAEKLGLLADFSPRLLAPIRHRSDACQKDLCVLQSRDTLVACRTQLVNHVRGTLKSFGHRLPTCSSRSFAKKSANEVPKDLRPAILPVLTQIASLTKQIDVLDKKIEALCATHQETSALRQIQGVGPITALAFVLILEDHRRFRRSRQVGAYVGLCPRKNQTGESDPELRITKAGNAHLRYLLVQASHYILGPHGPDTDLKRWGLALAARGHKNAKKRAVVAVARKLSTVLHSLWRTGEDYEPLRLSNQRLKRKRTRMAG